MLSGNYSAAQMSNLFSSQNENNSIFGSSTTESTVHNTDISQALKSLCLPSSWLNSTSPVTNTSEDRSRTNLIINYLPQSYDQSDLQRLFERLGPIRQCKLIRDKNTGASLCYGFVDYICPQHAALAIQTYHGYETESKRLRVAYASSGGRRFLSGQRTPSLDVAGLPSCMNETSDNIIGWEILVSGLPAEVTESDIMRLFAHFGSVLSVRFLPSSDHLKQFASGALADISCNTSDVFGSRTQTSKSSTTSVIFEDRLSCDNATNRLNGLQLPDCNMPLSLRLVGPVTRDTFAMFYMNSRQNSECNSIASMPIRHPSSTSNHLSDKLASSGLPATLTNGLSKLQQIRVLENGETNENAIPGLNASSLIQPRPIIRNKCLGSSNVTDNFDFTDLLDNAPAPSALHRNTLDRFSQQENHSIFEKTSLQTLNVKSDVSSNIAWPSCTSPLTTNDTFRNGLRSQELSLTKKLSIVTPLLSSSQMSAVVSQRGGRATVYLKLENLQPTGSVMLRGMELACRKFAAMGGAQHIVCPSAGNAGVAAAYASQCLNMACTIVTPEGSDTLTKKRLAVEAPSAKIVSFGSTLAEASRRAEQMVSDANEQLHQLNGSTDSAVRFLHPYENLDVWSGYEAIVHELPSNQQPDVIVVSVGGGGLLSGIIQGLWNRGWSNTHVVAMETEGADCLSRSVAAGQPVVMSKCTSIATSLCAQSISHRTWSIIQCHPVTAVTCTDAEALSATRRFLDDHNILVEPACGAALAAVYSGTIARLQQEGVIPRPATVCMIVCGGRNVNLQTLTEYEKKVNSNTYNNKRQSYGLKHLDHLLGAESLLADLDDGGRLEETDEQVSDMHTSSSNSPDIHGSTKALTDTDDQSRN